MVSNLHRMEQKEVHIKFGNIHTVNCTTKYYFFILKNLILILHVQKSQL